MNKDDSDPLVIEARSFLDDLFETGKPLQTLLRTGEFPAGWVDRYLGFLKRVELGYVVGDPLPHEVFAVIYNASVYCPKRYQDWLKLGGKTNPDTFRDVVQVRLAGDFLILKPYWKTTSDESPSDLQE